MHIELNLIHLWIRKFTETQRCNKQEYSFFFNMEIKIIMKPCYSFQTLFYLLGLDELLWPESSRVKFQLGLDLLMGLGFGNPKDLGEEIKGNENNLQGFQAFNKHWMDPDTVWLLIAKSTFMAEVQSSICQLNRWMPSNVKETDEDIKKINLYAKM